MAIEIERKFLVANDSWREDAVGTAYKQGYILNSAINTVRVRVAGNKGILTIKGQGSDFARPEYEYEIPLSDAEEMLAGLCLKPLIEKTRYKLRVANHVWDLDVFHADNQGLVLAEIELSEEYELFEKPDWLGKEVTGDERYFNAYLVRHPYSSW